MPRKNTVRQDVEGGFYHIYNRGVNKGEIFKDKKDYLVFLRFLKEYLLPPSHKDLKVLQGFNPRRRPINCHDLVELLAFCLIPNHFHLFVRQLKSGGVSEFMRVLATNYSMYFNYRHKRVGPLFQGNYKSVLIQNEPYFVYITKYIHMNPAGIITKVKPSQELKEYSYSSYPNYLGMAKADWLNTKIILEIFQKNSKDLGFDSYKRFVEDCEAGDGVSCFDEISWLLLDNE